MPHRVTAITKVSEVTVNHFCSAEEADI